MRLPFRSTGWSLTVLLFAAACARHRSADPFAVSPDVRAVQPCGAAIAVSEGFTEPVHPGSGSAVSPTPGRGGWRESLIMRVRLTPDSAVPNASIRSATQTGRSGAPISPAGQRILGRINHECRFAREG